MSIEMTTRLRDNVHPNLSELHIQTNGVAPSSTRKKKNRQGPPKLGRQNIQLSNHRQFEGRGCSELEQKPMGHKSQVQIRRTSEYFLRQVMINVHLPSLSRPKLCGILSKKPQSQPRHGQNGRATNQTSQPLPHSTRATNQPPPNLETTLSIIPSPNPSQHTHKRAFIAGGPHDPHLIFCLG